MAAEITDDQLAELVLAPKRSRAGDKEVESHSVADILKAAEYLRGLNRTRSANPLRTHPLSPPGTQ